jgi:tetratricopeptide (TPR) repeat protein
LYAEKKDPRSLKLADILLSNNITKTEKEAYYIKGLYYSFNQEKIKAIGFFDKCLSLNYTYMNAYREKAIALYDLGKFSEALAVLDKAITLQNNFDEGYYYSGRCLEKLNRIPEAIQSYQNALVYDPDYVEAKDALTRLGIK